MTTTTRQVWNYIKRNRKGIIIGKLSGLATAIIISQNNPDLLFTITQTQSLIDPLIQTAQGTLEIAATKLALALILIGGLIGSLIEENRLIERWL